MMKNRRLTYPTSDPINPAHYKDGPNGLEVIDAMVVIWGKENTAVYCSISAFKYRMRAGKKGDAAEDIKKAEWFEDKAKELKK